MPMGIVSEKDFVNELSKVKDSSAKPISDTTTIPTAEVVDAPSKGRGQGSTEVPNALRQVIGEESITNGRQSAIDLAAAFHLKPSSVSAYAVGATSTATTDEKPNEPHLKNVRGRITTKALSTVRRAIQHITDEKLLGTSAKELAGIAKDMSAVVRSMEPDTKAPTNVNNGPTFVFYSPQQRREESYDVVYAKE